jgi:hypothetical protein
MTNQQCPRGCVQQCSYHSPPGDTRDWCVGQPDPAVPNHIAFCSGSCSCSDLFWDKLFSELEDPIQACETKLQSGRDLNLLFLHIPDLDEMAETHCWHAKGVVTGTMDPHAILHLSLPPCMHRIYATLDSIRANWEIKKSGLIRVQAERQKKALREYREEKVKLACQKREKERKFKKATSHRGKDPEKLTGAFILLRRKNFEYLQYLQAGHAEIIKLQQAKEGTPALEK